jgi:hypothetical protein
MGDRANPMPPIPIVPDPSPITGHPIPEIWGPLPQFHKAPPKSPGAPLKTSHAVTGPSMSSSRIEIPGTGKFREVDHLPLVEWSNELEGLNDDTGKPGADADDDNTETTKPTISGEFRETQGDRERLLRCDSRSRICVAPRSIRTQSGSRSAPKTFAAPITLLINGTLHRQSSSTAGAR